MALSDLQVYSEYAYTTFTETLQQQVELFNAATGGAVTLTSAAHQGDFSQEAFFARIAGGTVRRRNAYGTGPVAEKSLTQEEDVAVKVAAGTPPILINPGQFRWIQMNPDVAGVVLGQQLAVDSMADMLNTGLGATISALSGAPEVVLDVSGDPAEAGIMSFQNMNRAQALFGDRSSRIQTWITHSAPLHGLYGQNLKNENGLFSYGTINVIRDPFGKIIVMTDSPQLIEVNADPTLNQYHTLGLTTAALRIGQNNDFDANEETRNGQENIVRTYQAEWSFNVGVKGFAWDKANGGKSPTDAALFQSTNWDRIVSDKKDLAGVVLTSRAA